MKRWSLAVIGLVVYAIGLIATAPATLIDASLRDIGQGKLRLVEARGTLWSGSGRIEIRDSGGRTGAAKSVAWRILPGSVLRGQLVCEVQLGQATPFPVTLSLSRIKLAKADISLPASVLGLGVPRIAPLGLTGELLLHVADISIERKQFHGNLTLQWREAGSALTPVSPLGDYELSIEGAGATVHASLRTLQGPLRLAGKGAWVNGGALGFLATASVPPQHQQQLGPLLRLIAVERSAGSFELQLR